MVNMVVGFTAAQDLHIGFLTVMKPFVFTGLTE